MASHRNDKQSSSIETAGGVAVSSDPTETTPERVLTKSFGGRMLGATCAANALDDLTAAGFAVVRADLPHGTELRRFIVEPVRDEYIHGWREVSS